MFSGDVGCPGTPELGIKNSPLLLFTGKKFDLSMVSKQANDQTFFGRPLDAKATRVAANFVPKLLSTIAFCCEEFGAFDVILVPLTPDL